MKMNLRISIKNYRCGKIGTKLVLARLPSLQVPAAIKFCKLLVKSGERLAMPSCFGLARTCGVPRGRGAARRGRHEFAPDGSGRDCVPSTPVGTSGREMTKGGPERH